MRKVIFGLFCLLQAASLAFGQPNIIFLLADDQCSDFLGCYGNKLIQTPTLDELAAKGVRIRIND
jgi:arylsulfatase A-like enzyme